MNTNFIDPKGDKMQRPDQTQLQYESEGWKRMLAFMLGENVYIKNRISEILRNNFDQSLLEQVDSFQNKVIKVDDLIRILRDEIADFDKLIIQDTSDTRALLKEKANRIKGIRNNVNYLEMLSKKIKSEFNSYLSENFES